MKSTPSIFTREKSFVLELLIFLLFLSLDGNGQVFKWANQLKGTHSVSLVSIANDAFGNIFMVGAFSGTVDFDPGPGVANLVSSAEENIFVAKFSADGIYQWAFNIPVTVIPDNGLALTTDNEGNVILTGALYGSADFNPGPEVKNLTSNGHYDIFVAKYNSVGNYQWAFSCGNSRTDGGNSVVADAEGNIIVAGWFFENVDFDPSSGDFSIASYSSYGAGSNGIFIAKYNSSGSFVWVNRVDGPGPAYTMKYANLDVDLSGNVLVTGNFQGTVEISGPTDHPLFLVSSGSSDAFLAKYSSNGARLWAKKIGSTGADSGNAIKVATNGDVFFTGSFTGQVNFGSGVESILTSAGSTDCFLAKYSATTGNHLWSSGVGGSGNDSGLDISIDSYGNLFLTGYFYSTVDFDPGTPVANLTANTYGNGFISKYNSVGSYHWAFIADGKVTVDASVNFYVSGKFSGTLDLYPADETNTLTATGTSDGFLAKYDSRIDPQFSILTASTGYYGEAVRLSTRSAGSQGIVSYSVDNGTPGKAILDGDILTFTEVGSVTIKARISGNTDYIPSTETKVIIIKKAPQTITFNEITNKTCASSPFVVSASASSGLPLTFHSNDESVATVSGDIVTILKAGYVRITASQPGNENYEPATSKSQSFNVVKENQTITFNPLPEKIFGDATFTLDASSSSGLPVSFTYDTAFVNINNAIVTILKAGSSNIRAVQNGNTCYNGGNDVTRTLTVKKAQPIIMLSIPQTEFCFDNHPVITFIATHSLPVLSNKTGVTIQGNSLIFPTGSYASFRLYQDGDANHESAYTPYFNIYSRATPTGVTISTTDNTSFWPGGKVRLTRDGSADNFQWLLNGGDIPGATSAYYYDATQSGFYAVRYTENYSGVSCSSISNEITTHVLTESDINMYPNPANLSFTVQLPFAMQYTTQIKVLTQTGSIKYSTSISGGQLSKTISCNNWTTGNYVVILTYNSYTLQKMLVVQH